MKSIQFTAVLFTLILGSENVLGQAINKPPVIDAYITQTDPANLNSIRINIQNSNDPDGKIVKTEINANGTVFSNLNDVYYTEPISSRWSYSFKGAIPKLYSLKGQIPIIIKVWDNKNALSTKTLYVDANNEIKLQDNVLNKPLNLTNVSSAKKYNFNVSAADIDKKYVVTFNRIKKTNALQNLLAQLLNLLGINTPLNTFSGQVNINGIDALKADEITQSTTQIKKFIAVKSTNSISATFSNSQYNQVDLEIHEVFYIKEANLPIITANVKSNSITNEPILYFYIQDESSIFWEANINDTIYNQAITKYGGFHLADIAKINTFSVTAHDIFGNIASFSLQNITMDTVAPLITSKTPSLGSVQYTNQLPYNAPISLMFNEAVKSVSIDGTQAQISSDGLSANFNFSVVSQGSKNLTIVATDLAGNQTTDIVAFNLIFNTTPPVISVQNPVYSLQNTHILNLNFNIDSTIPTTTTVKLNGTEVLISDLKSFVNLPISTLREGINTIEIASVDAAGNISLPQSITVQVDSVSPHLTNFSPTENLQIYTNSLPYTLPIQFEFDESIMSATVDAGSGIMVGSNVFQGQVVINASGAIPIHVFATDIAGNVTEVKKNVYVHFSDKLPVLTFNPSISNILTNLPRVDISGSSDQQLTSILVNGSPMAIGLDGKSFSGFFDAIQDGVHQIEIVATDIFGNVTTTIQRVRVIVDLPPQLLKYAPTMVKTPTGYRIDWGPLFNGPDKASICGALDQIFAAIPEAHAALDQIDQVKADINKYKEYVPDIVTRNVPDTTGVKNFIGNVEEPLNQIKGAYLSICKNVDILPALDCPGDRILFKMIMGKFPEEYIIRQMAFIPLSVQDVLIPRTNLCTGFDDSGLTCDEMIKLTPLIGEIFSPAVAEVMSSPIAQGVMDILLCEDLCAAPLVKEQPLLCKDVNIPGFPRVKKMPTHFNFAGPSGGISMDWGGSSNCGGFFNTCGSGGSSASCGWFDSCGGAGADGSINGRDFACSAFPSLWFCSSGNPLTVAPPTGATVVNIQPVPLCDPSIKLIDLINANPTNSTMIVSRYLATCMSSAVPFLPDIKKPVITVTSPAQNASVTTTTVRVTGFVDDVSSKVKIEGVVISTIVGANGIYFDEIISVPTDGLINIEAADAAGNLAVPVEVKIVIPNQTMGPTDITAGIFSVCAIINSKVFCWGKNNQGSLGLGDTVNRAIPTEIQTLGNGVSALAGTSSHFCAIKNEQLFCWGANNQGQIGDGTFDNQLAPKAVPGMSSGVTKVAAGNNHTCAVKDKKLFCWGYNSLGQLGLGHVDTRVAYPQEVVFEYEILDLTAGDNHTCAVTKAGGAFCWGSNENGKLGIGYAGGYSATPTMISFSGLFSKIKAGTFHTCAIVSGAAKCWGKNDGLLGTGDIDSRFAPASVVDLSNNVEDIAVGFNHTCAIQNGISKCWGGGEGGAIGNGSNISSIIPLEVGGISTSSFKIVNGYNFSCASQGSTLKCWGVNWSGNLGNGNLSGSTNYPVDVMLP